MRKVEQNNISDYVKRFEVVRKLRTVIPKSKRHQYNLLKVKKEGFIRLDGNLCFVQDIYTYEERSKKGKVTWTWQELELYDIEDAQIKYLEVEEDDGLEITLSNAEIKVRELNTSFKNIRAIVDEEEGSLVYKGVAYYYEDDSKAFFIKSDKEEPVSLFEFESDNNEYITVEAWGDGADEYQIHHSVMVDEQRIEIIEVGE